MSSSSSFLGLLAVAGQAEGASALLALEPHQLGSSALLAAADRLLRAASGAALRQLGGAAGLAAGGRGSGQSETSLGQPFGAKSCLARTPFNEV